MSSAALRSSAQSASVIVTDWITTSSCGRSLRSVVHRLHLRDHVEALHDLAEQRVLRRQAARRTAPLTMKNWLPLVFGPALAIATEPIS